MGRPPLQEFCHPVFFSDAVLRLNPLQYPTALPRLLGGTQSWESASTTTTATTLKMSTRRRKATNTLEQQLLRIRSSWRSWEMTLIMAALGIMRARHLGNFFIAFLILTHFDSFDVHFIFRMMIVEASRFILIRLNLIVETKTMSHRQRN